MPVWHEVSQSDVANYSPSLANIVAIRTSDQTVNQVALELLKRARRDIVEGLGIIARYQAARRNAVSVSIDPKELKPGPKRRDKLSPAHSVRVAAVYDRLCEVVDQGPSEFAEPLVRDVNPESEIQWLEVVALAYSQYTSRHTCSLEDKQAVYSKLIGFILHGQLEPKESVRDQELWRLMSRAGAAFRC